MGPHDTAIKTGFSTLSVYTSMTLSCWFPWNWGKHGSEVEYYRKKLEERGIPYSIRDDLPTLKRKWQTRKPLR